MARSRRLAYAGRSRTRPISQRMACDLLFATPTVISVSSVSRSVAARRAVTGVNSPAGAGSSAWSCVTNRLRGSVPLMISIRLAWGKSCARSCRSRGERLSVGALEEVQELPVRFQAPGGFDCQLDADLPRLDRRVVAVLHDRDVAHRARGEVTPPCMGGTRAPVK